MNENLIRLAERRATLIARAETQRQTLAQAAEPMHKPLALADHGLTALRYLGRNPVLLAGTAAVVAVLRPRFLFKWAQHGWLAWRIAQGIRDKLSR